MHVLTVYAHPDPESFCHAVLERFTAGLRDAGHTCEVVDLYAIDFDPVFRERDFPSYITRNTPDYLLERGDLRRRVLGSSRNPFKRLLARRWLRDKSLRDIAGAIHETVPEDVREQQRKVAAADGLAFIAPVYFVGFPAILKGWVERVFTLGFAYELTAEGWAGGVYGRLPLLTQKKALIINTTIFDERSYDAGIRDAMHMVMDEWCFRFPGVRAVQHEYFYAMHAPDAPRRARRYLERAYELGDDFQPAGESSRERSVDLVAAGALFGG